MVRSYGKTLRRRFRRLRPVIFDRLAFVLPNTQRLPIAILLVSAVVALTGCGATDHARRGPLPPPITEKTPLTIMSFNIRLGLGREDPNREILYMKSQWGRNLDAVIEAIRSADPDIVGLQEVAGPDQLRQIARALDMNHVFVWHETVGNQKPWWGVGLLSKYPITSSVRASLSDDRNFVIASVDVGPRNISIVTLHRSHLEFSEQSLPILMGELSQIELPILVTGDFNITPEARMRTARDRKQLQPILDKFLDTAREAPTKTAEQASQAGTYHRGGRTDYIFAEKGNFRILDAGLVAAEYRNASDHIAYFAKVILRE